MSLCLSGVGKVWRIYCWHWKHDKNAIKWNVRRKSRPDTRLGRRGRRGPREALARKNKQKIQKFIPTNGWMLGWPLPLFVLVMVVVVVMVVNSGCGGDCEGAKWWKVRVSSE